MHKYLMTASVTALCALFAAGATAQSSGSGGTGAGGTGAGAAGSATGAGTAGTDTGTAAIGTGHVGNEAVTRQQATLPGDPPNVRDLRTGMEVVSVSGVTVGKVAGVVRDPQGRLTDVLVQMDGANSSRVPVKVENIRAAGDLATVAMTETEIEELPTYRE